MVAIRRVIPGSSFVEFSRQDADRSIVERFEAQVRKNRERVAVQTHALRFTYGDLNQLANRLARVLLGKSHDDTPVAIVMDHGAAAVIAIVGALKAGKIFVLLDPALPDARIEQILDDSGANLIVTNTACLEENKQLLSADREFVNLDDCSALADSTDLNLEIAPDRPSYILYTSGSTGSPKGVVRTHRNDLHNMRNRTNTFGISREDRITLLGSFSTGQGMADIYSALLNSATLFPRNLKREGFHGLAEWLFQEKMTIFHSSTTLFRHFVGELGDDFQFPSLRIINIGGEPVTWKDVQLYKERFADDCVLVNELSCSEVSTFGQYFVDKTTEINATVPVGYPVEDKEVLILDENSQPLGAGEIGEITIASQYLSPGYWKRPDLTALAFRENPRSGLRRIYRTGDLGRKAADGCLEYLGRRDARVKIRGYRVECYEIELALLDVPAIDQAFVNYRQDGRGENQLIAYVVCAKGKSATVNDLRMALATRLPEYMLPAAFVFMDALPLMPSGKIDRGALPEPEPMRPRLDVPFVFPRDPREESVADLCSEVLGVRPIGVDDNLFDLGGNSLLAMQIVSRLAKNFRVTIPLVRFYSSPTIASLSVSIAREQASPNISLGSTASADRIPLSYFQERLWFLAQWEGASPAYNICQAFHLKGTINVWAIEESFNTVIKRHDILRTSFGALEGEPFQVVDSDFHVRLEILDSRTLPEEKRFETALTLSKAEARRTFDLKRSPLLRVLLLRLADDEHLLVFTVHQIICDGWSAQILLSECWQCYEVFCRGDLPSHSPLEVQYADFAIWQRQTLTDDRMQSQIAFWQETLKGVLPVLALPTDFARPAVESFRGARVSFALPTSLAQALNEFSRHEGVTLFMTLLAVFKTLLFRYAGQEDLIVGFPTANRSWAPVRPSIGFFVNTLVARTVLSGEETFRDLVSRLRDVCYAAYAQQDVPFEKIVEVVRPARDASHNPLFQAMFTFQNLPGAPPVPANVSAIPMGIDNGTAKVDLALSLAERADALAGYFEYSTDLFENSTIERMAGHFRTLLESAVADSRQTISRLPLLSEPELRQILYQWNDTAADYPKDKCLHDLFEEQAERRPDAIAVQFEEQQLNYRDLNHRANQLAHYLIELGIGSENFVAVILERSIEAVVGLMAILKTGAAYLPLDPAYPRERLEFMLNDAQVAAILTREELLSRFQPQDLHRQRLYVCLDRDHAEIARQSTTSPELTAGPENLAYLIYTSGSTGRPKGVQVCHRSVINCLHAVNRACDISEGDIWLAVTTLSFDIAALEIFLPLTTGATLSVASREEILDAAELAKRLASSGATIMQATPTTWNVLLETGWAGLPGFKVLCGGESLSRRLANNLLATDAIVWNCYGPTETTIWSALHKVETGEGPVYIGQPIANTQIYILDRDMQPVPIGVHGDLYIGGDGLSRGYLNRSDLTVESFLRNPFSADPGSRVYKTGDRARYRPDSAIEFLGRTDDQIKIRGHRIELAEIEAALIEHSTVKQCAVAAFDDVASESDNPKSRIENPKLLVAYIVPVSEALPSAELRSFLAQRLPDYMIPSLFVALGDLPMTPNGKVDRNALLLPGRDYPPLTSMLVEPRSDLEDLVAQVWRDLLKRDRIGVFDNFFDLGGHSLLAMRVVARLRAYLAIELPLRKLFDLPSVAQLSEYIELLRRIGSDLQVPPIVPASRMGLIPASFSQQRLWFLRQLDPDATAYNVAAIFAIHGPLDVSNFERALNAVIGRHEILRTVFGEVGGSPVQIILPALEIRVSVIDLTNTLEPEREASARELALAEARRPFDLRDGPLLRAKVLAMAEQDFYVVLNIDHMILDGTSMAVFFRELSVCYEALRSGSVPALPKLEVQYADYAVWQHERLCDGSLDPQFEYWKRQLGHGLPSTEFPADHGRPALQASRGARLTKTLSAELIARLKELSRREGATLFMSLLATFDIIAERYTGVMDVVVGSTVAARSRRESETLMGFFINALPLRVDISGNPSFTDLLKRVREVCLDAYSHQDLPFEKIVAAINPQREINRNPLFQIMFNVADVSERLLALTDCVVTPAQLFDPEAKFDLTFYAPEKDGAIELAVVYNTELFEHQRIAAMLEEYGFLLEQIAAHPQKPIEQYDLLTPAAKSIIPDPLAPPDRTWYGAIHEILSRVAAGTADRLAISDAVSLWSYGELERASNQLANDLIANGIQATDRVAIYAHRDATLIIALMGVLKAGAAFVILDPAYPAARLISYLRIAQPRGWIQLQATSEPAGELLQYLEAADMPYRRKLPQDKALLLKQLEEFSDNPPAINVGPDDPAYIAFTSGTTGEPKGVLSRHGPITHFLPWQKEAFGFTQNDRFSLLSGLAYNHFHRDVFTPLALGAALYVPPAEIAREPQALREWLSANDITVLHLTPALGQLLLSAKEPVLPSVRRIFFGGDVLTQTDVARIRGAAPNATIGCFYGATETQRAVGYYEISPDFATNDTDANQPIPLGRGIEDVQLLVLNKNGALAGIGELGDLYVRSPHMAQAYVGDPARTAEVFVTNPFSGDPEDRLYKTGELARYLPDGNVAWAGRSDRRVSIRGFRIELEEIESCLKQHQVVKDAAVMLANTCEDLSDSPKSAIQNPKSLVAYVVADEDPAQSLFDLLHGYLGARLPDYMVPAHFVIVDQLPLSPNGKVDYQALPPVRRAVDDTAVTFEPRTETEAKLCEIFAEVLGRQRVGVDENFFRIGGHSLLAAQAAARIRERLGIVCELRAFFEVPTVAGLAKMIQSRLQAEESTPIKDEADREEIEF